MWKYYITDKKWIKHGVDKLTDIYNFLSFKAKYFVSKDYFVEGLQKSTRWYLNVFIVTETMFIISYVYLLRLSIPRKRKKLMKGYRKKKDALWHWRGKKKMMLKSFGRKEERIS